MNAEELIALSITENRTVTEYPDHKAVDELLSALLSECAEDCPGEHISGEGYDGEEAKGYYDFWGTTDDGDDWRINVVCLEQK